MVFAFLYSRMDPGVWSQSSTYFLGTMKLIDRVAYCWANVAY